MNRHPSELQEHLLVLYGPGVGRETAERLEKIIQRYAPQIPPPEETVFNGRMTEKDAVLITYGDQVREDGQAPLQTLADFCAKHLVGLVTGIHILPFYPYSSDDGFSVIDYCSVDPKLGSWTEIERLRAGGFGLMFDAVINHISVQSAWFQGFLQDNPRYRGYFMVVEGSPDLSAVVRPRALPLLTRFQTAAGEKDVWTTFSEDQVDLNYRNPEVLLEVVDTILFYVSKGAELIRLDAIAYLWKSPGSTCIHLPETHRIIRLLRSVLDQAAPHVLLITETNVPHTENISYFGNGRNEAQMVYNFALPPLVLHTFLTGDAGAISAWADGLELPTNQVTFFNFLASHDGIGLNPVRGILEPEEIDRLVDLALARGGRVSYKHNPDGSQSPYELNISYFDALSDPNGSEPLERQADRFAAAHALLLSVTGVPGIYFHSLFGSRSWQEGVAQTGRSRTINREKLTRSSLERELAAPFSLRRMVYERFNRLLRARADCKAFDPHGSRQQVFYAGAGLFGVVRSSPDVSQQVYCLQNVTGSRQEAQLPERLLNSAEAPRDLLSGERVTPGPEREIVLEPYQTLWLVVWPA